RLADDRRPGRTVGRHRIPGARRRAGTGLARIAAVDRTHASDPSALRPYRLPGGRRPALRRTGRFAAFAACPRDFGAALPAPLAALGYDRIPTAEAIPA